jgi:hypothetical protein
MWQNNVFFFEFPLHSLTASESTTVLGSFCSTATNSLSCFVANKKWTWDRKGIRTLAILKMLVGLSFCVTTSAAGKSIEVHLNRKCSSTACHARTDRHPRLHQDHQANRHFRNEDTFATHIDEEVDWYPRHTWRNVPPVSSVGFTGWCLPSKCLKGMRGRGRRVRLACGESAYIVGRKRGGG